MPENADGRAESEDLEAPLDVAAEPSPSDSGFEQAEAELIDIVSHGDQHRFPDGVSRTDETATDGSTGRRTRGQGGRLRNRLKPGRGATLTRSRGGRPAGE